MGEITEDEIGGNYEFDIRLDDVDNIGQLEEVRGIKGFLERLSTEYLEGKEGNLAVEERVRLYLRHLHFFRALLREVRFREDVKAIKDTVDLIEEYAKITSLSKFFEDEEGETEGVSQFTERIEKIKDDEEAAVPLGYISLIISLVITAVNWIWRYKQTTKKEHIPNWSRNPDYYTYCIAHGKGNSFFNRLKKRVERGGVQLDRCGLIFGRVVTIDMERGWKEAEIEAAIPFTDLPRSLGLDGEMENFVETFSAESLDKILGAAKGYSWDEGHSRRLPIPLYASSFRGKQKWGAKRLFEQAFLGVYISDKNLLDMQKGLAHSFAGWVGKEVTLWGKKLKKHELRKHSAYLKKEVNVKQAPRYLFIDKERYSKIEAILHTLIAHKARSNAHRPRVVLCFDFRGGMDLGIACIGHNHGLGCQRLRYIKTK